VEEITSSGIRTPLKTIFWYVCSKPVAMIEALAVQAVCFCILFLHPRVVATAVAAVAAMAASHLHDTNRCWLSSRTCDQPATLPHCRRVVLIL
jgi:hypothetical protein